MISYDVDGTSYSAQLSVTLQYGYISSPGVMSFQLGSVMLVGENSAYYLFMGAPAAVWTGLGVGSTRQSLKLGPVSINPPASTLDPAVQAGLADALSKLIITTHADSSTLTAGKPTTGTFAIEAATFGATPAVPEPATWALMIAGFGTAGVALRGRKRATA
ncbi:PEPxxWA-CTERM sorting domain-containing protein [Sphingomonas sp. XMGL2]|uniref:PEPxxWA-CTERM sorting domain-containing protein n=2 Tax=Sphingomonas quercus TaxID=2842451 RepID=A0ABS6BKC8_9SPHN|nr:PEPxxWA-CTERM sorting domain-containing protein [Sphingomonas quercus]